ncbi:hypothetical protein [Thermicanus aegyptius]|uniref:hypothetical protein n=1 Tax=Thermicanus aegyptius TaxID=94009 RepID=UPI0004079512|nr:hypothetical protein [Thermicanus aegyptius]
MLHWGLILMAYPYFREMAGQAGRLLQIQGEFSTIQIRRKMSALYGEREKVNVATKKILKTWKDLNVILPKEKAFIGQVIPITNTMVKQWVCEAYLRATGKVAVEVNHLHEEPSLFPFQFTLVEQELKENKHLQLIYGQEAIRVGIR